VNFLLPPLDVNTLLLTLVLVQVLIASTLWAAISPGARHGVMSWTLSLGMQGAVFMLLALRTPEVHLTSIVLANLFGALSLTLQADALLRFRGSRLHPAWLAGIPVAMATLMWALGGSEALRFALNGAIFGAGMVGLAILAIRTSQPESTQGRRLLAGGYLLEGAMMLARALALTVVPEAFESARLAGSVPAASALVAFVVALVTSMGFLLMHRERREASVSRLATIDSLTGIFNRRSFFELGEKSLAYGRRHGTPVSLVLLDLDHFKQINDSLGHHAGDGVLRHFVGVVQACLRKEDVLTRYGGEEFCVLLPVSGPEVAHPLAERIRTAVERARFEHEGERLTITTSAGVATALPGEGTLESLVQHADAALYAAKREGRNRVVLAAPA